MTLMQLAARMVVVALVVFPALLRPATIRISGRVLDQTAVPIPETLVTLRVPGSSDPGTTARTDEGGNFTFADVRPDTYELRFQHVGFEPSAVTVSAFQDTNVGTVVLGVPLSDQDPPFGGGIGDLPPECCPTEEVRLTPRQMKARLRHTEPVLPPSLGKDVKLKGTVVFIVGFDASGNVTCLRLVSGHPLLVPGAMESVLRWKFQPFVGGRKQILCGKLALALSTPEPAMELRVLPEEP